MENLSLKLESIEGNELVIRQGDAAPPFIPEPFTVVGDIKSVSTYIAGRRDIDGLQGVDREKAIVVVDKFSGTISLDTDPNNPHASQVTGKLEYSEALQAFRINEKKTMVQKEVVEILKFNKVHFADPSKQADLLKAYQSFSYTANTAGTSSSDTRGNKENSFTKSVTTKLPDEFILHIPIFKGEVSKTFRVEICLDATDGGARFWFESVELHELIEIEKEIIFKRELTLCEGLVIIHK